MDMSDNSPILSCDKRERNRPRFKWTRSLGAAEPSRNVHTFSRPPMMEALSLLPVAMRVGSYIMQERKKKREPIFDLNGLMLEPPNPGPHSGCPLGALGGGCIGRGYRGDFRRWSLHPGKYSHETVHGNQFSIRVRRGEKVFSKVLSIFDGKQAEKHLRSWDWGVPADKVTYHSVFPRAWTDFQEPIPGVNVEILQISPVLPNNYSDASLPCCVFEVNVTNIGQESIECSVMFTFQNSDGTIVDSEPLDSQGFAHESFVISGESVRSQQTSEVDNGLQSAPAPTCESELTFEGVCMARHHVTRVLHDEATSSVPLHSERKQQHCANKKKAQQQQEQEQEQPIGHMEASESDQRPSESSFSSATAACMGGGHGHKEINHSEYVFADQGSFAVATVSPPQSGSQSGTAQDVSTCSRFVVDAAKVKRGAAAVKCATASDLWSCFHESGSLRSLGSADSVLPPESHVSAASATALPPPPLGSSSTGRSSHKRQDCAAAVCVQRIIPAGAPPSVFKFALAWDNPVVRFGAGRGYSRYHSRFFGTSGLSAPSIAAYALSQVDEWNSKIEQWQESIVADDSLPEYYRHLLFNELYYLVDGGTVWVESDPLSSSEQQHAGHAGTRVRDYSVAEDMKRGSRLISHGAISRNDFVGTTDEELSSALAAQRSLQVPRVVQAMRANDEAVLKCQGEQATVGRFLYLEGHEYLMYNTYDVHFYASFALLMLWPQLELSLQRDFASSVCLHDHSTRVMLGEGERRPRKVAGAVPHDLGSPTEDPFHRTNIYNFQDVSRWKDLGPKFILQIYRDYRHTQSPWFLVDMFPVALQVMQSTALFDRNGDGMIENEGFPDQTYDIWIASGVHAYCGGLWIAACLAMAAMGGLLNDAGVQQKYASLAEKAKEVYIAKLWNGEYFDYDSSNSGHHDSIMADMMAGHWYSILCGLPPIIPADKALSCFRKIYSFNVEKFGRGGMMGAVNGMRPDGTIDSSCLQSREVWTGTTYGLAAAMIHEAKRGGVEVHQELYDMGVNTARGIHDAGWERFGYHFATPEAWEQSGNYRSLGYMRPLAVWAIQYALEHEHEHGGEHEHHADAAQPAPRGGELDRPEGHTEQQGGEEGERHDQLVQSQDEDKQHNKTSGQVTSASTSTGVPGSDAVSPPGVTSKASY